MNYIRGRGGHKKPIYSGEIPKKGLKQFSELGVGKKEESGVFEGG